MSSRQRRPAAIALALAATTVALVVALAISSDSSTVRASRVVGRPAPPVAGPTLQGGTFDLADHKGRWVVVNFFSTTCRECIIEHPELARFEAQNRAWADVVSIAVAGDESNAAEFFANRGGSWPLLLDRDGRLLVDFGLVLLPESFIVDPTGRVAAQLLGGVTVDDIEQAIDSSAQIIAPRAGSAP